VACLVEEQEENLDKEDKSTTKVDLAMTATTVNGPANKVAAHWARKIHNRTLRKTGILDTGATSSTAPEEDEDCFDEMGIKSTKTFMFSDKQTNKATKRMNLKHDLRETAREINIVPGLHSTLISVPKLADAGYMMVFTKDGAAIYDDYATQVMANTPPVLEADRCDHTGLWKLPLHARQKEPHEHQHPTEAINVDFDLPSACQTFLWYHVAAGFPVKETFIKAVRSGNYATWPKLTVNLIHKYMPDSDETAEGHLKGQPQGIRSTKQRVVDKLLEGDAHVCHRC
jgi:hypothetical protein